MTPSKETNNNYWFPSKRYGWGWGLPCRWQGWVVFVMFIVGMTISSVVFAGHEQWVSFAACNLILAGLVIAICFWKGEPPRWRWGG